MSDKFDPTTLTVAAARLQDKFFQRIRLKQATTRMRDAEVAERAGITPSYYSMLQNCKRPLSLNASIAIAGVFNLDISYNLTTYEEEA